jgi:hypothetical protein
MQMFVFMHLMVRQVVLHMVIIKLTSTYLLLYSDKY